MTPGVESVRELHRVRVLDLLREHGAASRAALVRATGLSRPTVAGIVADLLAADAIQEVGTDATGAKGRPSRLFAPVPPPGHALSVDVGHTHVRALVADASGRARWERVVNFGQRLAPADALGEAARLVGEAAADDVVGAAIGLPSPVDPAGRPTAARFRGLDPLAVLPPGAYPDRIGVHNDADLGAAGEAAFGAGSRFNTFIYVKISHGLGAGLILDRKLYRGRGYAGNIGHLRVADDGEVCLCGNRGCLETVASSNALLRALQPAHPGVPLGFADLVRMADAADRGTQALLSDTGRIIGRALSMLVTTLNPDAIVVGGALGSLGGALLRGIREALERYSQPAALQDLAVITAECGERAEALGGIAVTLRLVDQFGSVTYR
ncbi:ROK family protein [Amycolatopsis sp. NPDC051061]|uniref:ROK family transcriptional regulator n=1 Tax=Amycolatopsis sp. NPDC051061 TaxID=3155042 RepID=UPI003432C0F7